jgi:predicted O-methyltransferase YrrM
MHRFKIITSLIKERLKLKRGAEIGVWRGECTEYLLNKHKKLTMYCFDPYEYYPHYVKHHSMGKYNSQEKLNELYGAVRNRLNKKFRNRLVFMRKRSVEASFPYDEGWFDFVFLDGNWGYQYVKWDIEWWLPKIRKGGVMIGHRINSNKDGYQCVKRAVEEMLGNGYKVKGGRWFYVI